MMEEAMPSIFASVSGWFTPAVLFVLLNLVIGTIAVASKSSHHHQPGGAHDHEGVSYPGRFLARSLSRSPSIVLDRLRSFNLHRHTVEEIPPPLEAVPAPEAEISVAEAERFHHEDQHLDRSQSDPHPRAGEMPPKLAVRMKKSASEKSAFAHFKAAEVEEAAAAATTRGAVDPAEEEVDARADDFINRFRQQLKLQRLDSILRYKEMLNRGT